MLKEFVLFKALGLVLGLAPSFRPPPYRVVGRDATDAMVIEADPGPPSAPDPVSKADAIRAYFEECMEADAGGYHPFWRIKEGYLSMAPSRGWPVEMSDKALSQGMVALGCERRKVDQRASGGGRASFLFFPWDGDDPVEVAADTRIAA